MNGPNWAALYAQGRVKDIGVPWNEEEQAARAAGVPAPYVRAGILTMKDYDKAVKDGLVSPHTMSREDLVKLGKKLKIEFTPDVPSATLISLITAAQAAGKVGKAPKAQKVGGVPKKSGGKGKQK